MELDVRGTPADQVRAYLVCIGGQEQANGSFAGAGWTAALTVRQHRAFGTLVPRVVIHFAGEAAAVAAAVAALKLRTMRVGG